MVFCSVFSYAEELSLSACIRTKDAKQRLVCYDKAAPSAIKQLNEFDGAKASALDKKALEVEAALKEQQRLVRDTLRELRKLNTATEVGISKAEYSRRVIDVASTVKLNLPEIDNVAVREKIEQTLTAYIDANEFWEGMYRDKWAEIFFKNYRKDLARYGVTFAVVNNETFLNFREKGVSQEVLSLVWASATRAINEAEALIARP